MGEDRYRLEDFELYRTARAFRNDVYKVLRWLPSSERYALDVQMRKAAVSVSNNVAEGHGRWQYQDNTRFQRIARGSVSELIDDFNVCLDQGYGDAEFINQLKNRAYDLIHRINGYISYLQRTKQGDR